MRCEMSVLFAVMTLNANTALAGAWLKEKGTGFASVGLVTVQTPNGPQSEGRTYLEFGASETQTLGLSAFVRPDGTGEILAFSRHPLMSPWKDSKFAVELGVGATLRDRTWHPLAKIGLSYGRGFENQWGYGWLAIDTALEHRGGPAPPLAKLDLTLGQSTGMAVRPILQIETVASADAFDWTIAPGAMWDRPNGITFVAQVEKRSNRQAPYGIRLSLWRKF